MSVEQMESMKGKKEREREEGNLRNKEERRIDGRDRRKKYF